MYAQNTQNFAMKIWEMVETIKTDAGKSSITAKYIAKIRSIIKI